MKEIFFYEFGEQLAKKLELKYGINTSNSSISFRKDNLPGTLSLELGSFTELIDVLIISVRNNDETGNLINNFLKVMEYVAEWIHEQKKPFLILGNQYEMDLDLEDTELLLNEIGSYGFIPLDPNYKELPKNKELSFTHIYRTNQEYLPIFLEHLSSLEKEWLQFKGKKIENNLDLDMELYRPCAYDIKFFDKRFRIKVTGIYPFETTLEIMKENVTFNSYDTKKIIEGLLEKVEEDYRLSWLVNNILFPSGYALLDNKRLTYPEAKKAQRLLVDAGYSFYDCDIILSLINSDLMNSIEYNIKEIVKTPGKSYRILNMSVAYYSNESKHAFVIQLENYKITLTSSNIDSLSTFIESMQIIRH